MRLQLSLLQELFPIHENVRSATAVFFASHDIFLKDIGRHEIVQSVSSHGYRVFDLCRMDTTNLSAIHLQPWSPTHALWRNASERA
jgi:hypothetical protein